MTDSVAALAELLTLEPLGDGRYSAAPSAENHVRAFGGQLIGQAMGAFTMEAGERYLHSFHGYFLRPTAVGKGVEYRVEVLRQGRSFTHMRLVGVQGDTIVFTAMAAAHDGEDGRSHSADMPEVPGPDDCPPFEERFAGREADDDMGRWFVRASPFDIRPVGPTAFDEAVGDCTRFWFRSRGPATSAALNNAVLGYASDLAVLDPILLTQGIRWTDAPVIGASLDHAMWLHRRVDVTRWLLFEHRNPASGDGRGLATGTIWNEDGVVVASLAQEALLRLSR